MSEPLTLNEGHLGGCVEPTPGSPYGDPEAWSPRLWDWIVDRERVAAVLDVGCGLGFAARYFQGRGCRVLGIEGSRRVAERVASVPVLRHDLRDGPLSFPEGQFDLAWCCGVAEQIEPEFALNLLRTLAGCRLVLLTAGGPGQGGHHVANAQPGSYWIALMDRLGFDLDPALSLEGRALAAEGRFARDGLIFRRRRPSTEAAARTDLLLTWASGADYCRRPEMAVFLSSVAAHFPGAKVALTHDMDLESRARFADAGFHVRDVPPSQVRWVVRDRFLHFAEFLRNRLEQYGLVALVDSRDVLLLGDPAAWVHGRAGVEGDYLVLASEGMRHRDSRWNTMDQSALQKRVPPRPFEDWEVINGGFQIGTPRRVLDLADEVYRWTCQSTHDSPATDQAVLNYLYHDWQHNPALRTRLISPLRDGMIVHGEAIRHGFYRVGFDGERLTVAGRPCIVWHQWERTDHREAILRRFGADPLRS